MARSKKTKRDNRIVTYVRLKPEEHAQIAELAAKRGLPHTIASVAAEMISMGLRGIAKPSLAQRRAAHGFSSESPAERRQNLTDHVES